MARIGLGGPEQGVGAMKAVQDAQDTKAVVESDIARDKYIIRRKVQNIINKFENVRTCLNMFEHVFKLENI